MLYARVSSKEQEQGYSIQAQQEFLRPYAVQHNLVIEREFVDVATAKKPGRPGFTEMLQYLQEKSGCRVVLVEKTDRLYRNWGDATTVATLIEELGLEIHLVKDGQIYSQSSRAADKYRHGMDVLNAKRYIDNLSEEVQKGLRTKAAQGPWPSYAPLGYRNVTGEDGRKIIVPDPVLGPMVQQLFASFATGEYSLERLAQQAYAAGFRFRRSGNKIPISTLHKMLRKPIYMGEFDYGGVRYQGWHEPLVTREVWERVQEVLLGRHRKGRCRKHEIRYSGMVRCGHCGCALVAEIKKGRYIYYHCSGYRGKCQEPYTREERLQQEFAKGLQELSLPPAVVRWLDADLTASERNAQADSTQALRRHEAELERLQRRQEMMYDDRLDGRLDAGTYDQRNAQMQVQRAQIQHRIQTLKAPQPALGGPPVNLAQVLCRVGEAFSKQSAREQRKLLRVVVRAATWKDGGLQIEMREPFVWLRRAHQVAKGEGSRDLDQPTPAGSDEAVVRPVEASPGVSSLPRSESVTADEPGSNIGQIDHGSSGVAFETDVRSAQAVCGIEQPIQWRVRRRTAVGRAPWFMRAYPAKNRNRATAFRRSNSYCAAMRRAWGWRWRTNLSMWRAPKRPGARDLWRWWSTFDKIRVAEWCWRIRPIGSTAI